MTPVQIKELRAKRMNDHKQLVELLDRAVEEGRELTVDEQATEARLNAALSESGRVVTTVEERMTALAEAEQRQAETDAAFAALLKNADTRGLPGGAPVNSGDGARDEQSEIRDWLTGKSGKRTFEARAGKPMGTEEFRVLSKLTAGAGGNTVKTSFYEKIVAHLIEVSGIMQAGPTILNTSTGEQMLIPKTTGHSTGALVAEAGTIGASDPVFAQAPLDAYKYALLLQVSHELANDTSVDLMGYLAMQAGRALGNAFGAALATGTGSSQPQGVVPVATVGVTGATSAALAALTPPLPAGSFTADNLIDLFYSVIAPYRNSQSAKWVMKDATVAHARKLKDTNGQYLWQPSIQLGVPDSILGKGLVTDPFIPSIGLGLRSVLFGDFSQFYVRMVENLRFERSDDFAFNTDLITYRAILRADSELVDTTGAIKCFIGNAA